MSSSQEYINFVCEEIQNLEIPGIIRYRKMFGEYMIYINDKPIILVCDNTIYIKKLEEIKNLMIKSETGFPYKNAKVHYILDIENKTLTKNVLEILEKITPIPKSKKKKNK